MPSHLALQTGKMVGGVEPVAADDQALVAELAELLDEVAAVHRRPEMITRSGLASSTLVICAVKSVSVVWKVCTRGQVELRVPFTACWNVSRLRLAEGVVLREEHRDPLEVRVDLHRRLHGVGGDDGHGRRDARDVLADLRDALGRVRGPDDRHLGLVGDGVGGEGLLGEGRPHDADDLGDVDEVLEGVDRAGLVAAGVLEDQLDRPAVHPALLVEELLGDLGADHLLLADERDVARLGDGDPDRDRVGGESRSWRSPGPRWRSSRRTHPRRRLMADSPLSGGGMRGMF